MAKKKKDKAKKDGAQADAVDSIRAAIERGLQISAEGAQVTRERTRDLVDEIASAAGRVRQSIDDMRVLDELRRLRNEVEALGARVSALEGPAESRPAATATSASAAKPATSRASRSRATKPSAARKATTARKPAAVKSAATRSRAKKATAAESSESSAAAGPATAG